jgi:riboflavin synthase
MFTGIVEEVGRVADVRRGAASARLTVDAPQLSGDARIGDSICISGVCLTVVERQGERLSFDAAPETLRRSSLSAIRAGDPVNLERALQLGGRLGGHIVQGHVDGIGRIVSITQQDTARIVRVSPQADLARYIAEKGSVALDGISLTVMERTEHGFGVSVIPHTWDHTTLRYRRPGDAVNLEVDVLAKYVESLLGLGSASRNRLASLLAEDGVPSEVAP